MKYLYAEKKHTLSLEHQKHFFLNTNSKSLEYNSCMWASTVNFFFAKSFTYRRCFKSLFPIQLFKTWNPFPHLNCAYKLTIQFQALIT